MQYTRRRAGVPAVRPSRLHAGGEKHMVRGTIKAIEARLDPRRFLRIHRSAIVNLSRITAVEPISRAEYEVILDDGARVPCSRGYRNQLRERVFFSG